ncbi:hypothetical protein VHEMI04215 [[Torrubiella] hemipterigena]|uniref:DUF4419 domain-containing protein n=1 Tax=[Torrubiella] hemipterigena TaxID=1531966 RepID=A0A0A1TDM4_9HYPO|nr:hypothetical protein VHEMI04215 [[Torrubiella] hemipterigena]
MPVTIPVNDHAAEPWEKEPAANTKDILDVALPQDSKAFQEILQTSYNAKAIAEKNATSSSNGFVHAAIAAYNNHHHLTLRPEDVWFSILTQLSFYIKAHAEELRTFFVEHDDKKELEVVDFGTRHTVDFGRMARSMTNLIAKNVKDPALSDWVMPSFTTTTDEDRSVAAVLFMGAMQKYFSYRFSLRCGIPSVTLLGELSDWQDILKRLDFIDRLGEEPTKFRRQLQPILENMIRSFEQPDSPDVTQFWNTIAHKTSRASAVPFLSGWITAFCFWNSEGQPLGSYEGDGRGVPEPTKVAEVEYPRVKIPDIPPGSASVPVLLDDNGQLFQCTMVAGSAAIQAAKANEKQKATVTTAPASDDALTAVQPMSGWWICINEDQSDPKEKKANDSAREGENTVALASQSVSA